MPIFINARRDQSVIFITSKNISVINSTNRMNKKKPSELTDQELMFEVKRIKSTLIVNAVLFGVMIGIATYSTVTNGLGILTFFPLFFIPMGIKNRAHKKALENQLKERKLTV